ncbi:hypothetical protein L6452_02076 [Arctium lappa]|uniref:Uncharacterized protein n=1 Tax=Arctium lappa TaxID=4217 RepID=A0ACB9FJF5_ARCLA|nr:hypothetical protein L6452_02076 [Arctium lappa]
MTGGSLESPIDFVFPTTMKEVVEMFKTMCAHPCSPGEALARNANKTLACLVGPESEVASSGQPQGPSGLGVGNNSSDPTAFVDANECWFRALVDKEPRKGYFLSKHGTQKICRP